MAPTTIIFQAGKLGDVPQLLVELAWAKRLLDSPESDLRVYGLSGGALAALAFTLARAARLDPEKWGQAAGAPGDFARFLRSARSRDLRQPNRNPWFGIFNLKPLVRWVGDTLEAAGSPRGLKLSDLPVPLYLCAADRDGTFSLFGPAQPSLQFQYQHVRVGPPQDAPVLEALEAALSTLLSTSPVSVGGNWYRDCRPVFSDGGAIIYDLESAAGEPRRMLRDQPHTPLRTWRLNWITSSFIMHSQNERNQAWLAEYYLDLQERYHFLRSETRRLDAELIKLGRSEPSDEKDDELTSPVVGHIDLPYVGSTGAYTNMRESVEQKDALIAKFEGLLQGQFDRFPFHQPANLIYGAGGFSGILAGLTTTRLIDASFARGGGSIRQVMGVSAGVLNGFFHSVQLAGRQRPDLYRPAAAHALEDLEAFISHVTPEKLVKLNRNPLKLWQGWGSLEPLEGFLLERLATYTGIDQPAQITFDDIALPLVVAAARRDGFNEYFGMASLERSMHFHGREVRVVSAPVVKAILAGWSMNTYIHPTRIGEQVYTDGGGPFYDNGLFMACLDPEMTNLINVHLDEPEGHSYNIPPKPDLKRLLFDTHNYYFPEERRRMRMITDLLYAHYRLHRRYIMLRSRLPEANAAEFALPEDFRRTWRIKENV